MQLFKICGRCKRKRLWFNVHKRSYQTNADRLPVTTIEERCGRCYRKLKRFLKVNNLIK